MLRGRPRALQIIIGQALIMAGVVGLLGVTVAYAHALLGARNAIAAFERALANPAAADPLALPPPDQSRWSASRIQAFRRADGNGGSPLALLEIDRLNLRVPVFPGTDRVTLNRGAGIVDGTSHPGEQGNIVLSAHRDGFFRGLQDIRVGDLVRLRTLENNVHYEVREIFVTDPLDISVLTQSDSTELTLITCYPFYYLGFAPERFIVRGTAVDPAPEPEAEAND